MNLWFRFLALLLRTPFRPRLAVPHGVSRLPFRVWFFDLDTNGHVNNGRYWTLFDLGRTDMMLRMGLLGAVLKHKWAPIVGGAIRFRRELRLFQRFELETRILSWTETRVVFEHRILAEGGTVVATRSLVLAGLYDRKARGFVPVDAIFGAVGVEGAVPPPADPAVQAMLDLDAAMKVSAE